MPYLKILQLLPRQLIKGFDIQLALLSCIIISGCYNTSNTTIMQFILDSELQSKCTNVTIVPETDTPIVVLPDSDGQFKCALKQELFEGQIKFSVHLSDNSEIIGDANGLTDLANAKLKHVTIYVAKNGIKVHYDVNASVEKTETNVTSMGAGSQNPDAPKNESPK
jgi:hypothetical protein